jgi:NlpC/P60 family putative phage cell wall peptidase
MGTEQLVAEARRWIGTPYRHGASVRGLGCDCLGLVTGVASAVLGAQALPTVPVYPPDWAEASRRELLMEACDAHLLRPGGQARAGDLLLFRWRDGRPASHLAFVSGEGTIIHSHLRAVVAEVALLTAWRWRVAAVYRFREVA